MLKELGLDDDARLGPSSESAQFLPHISKVNPSPKTRQCMSCLIGGKDKASIVGAWYVNESFSSMRPDKPFPILHDFLNIAWYFCWLS